MMDRKPVRNMYRVLFQNKFEKSVGHVGFIIRIYHVAWSCDCQLYGITDSCLQVFILGVDALKRDLLTTFGVEPLFVIRTARSIVTDIT